MSYRKILVPVDSGDGAHGAVETAFALAGVFGAHVEGLHIRIEPADAVPYVGEGMSGALVQELIDRGFFTPEEAQANTPKNLVTRALGIDEQVEVDVQEMETLPGDIFLLCSDGLNDMVTDEEIRLTLSKYSANLSQAAHELVRQANEGGGKDNVSVVLARPRTATAGSAGLLAKVMGLFTRGS